MSDPEVAYWMKLRPKGTDAARPREALDYLIAAAWNEGEAFERGIVVTRTDARELLEEQVAQVYSSDAEFRRFLRENGRTRQDMITTIRDDTLRTAVRDQVREAAAKSVTPEQIEAYVLANPRVLPEQRRIRLVFAANRKSAQRAVRVLRAGLTWKSAIKRYGRPGDPRMATLDAQPNATGYLRAVLSAQKGELTRYGRHVFKVTKITPPRPAPLDEQRAQAWEILSSQAQEQALKVFATDFRAKWLPRTICAPAVQTHEDCGNPPTGE